MSRRQLAPGVPAPGNVAFAYRILASDGPIDCVAFPSRWFTKNGRPMSANVVIYSNASRHGESARLDGTCLRLTIPMNIANWAKAAAKDGVLTFPDRLASHPDLPKVPLVVTLNGVPMENP